MRYTLYVLYMYMYMYMYKLYMYMYIYIILSLGTPIQMFILIERPRGPMCWVERIKTGPHPSTLSLIYIFIHIYVHHTCTSRYFYLFLSRRWPICLHTHTQALIRATKLYQTKQNFSDFNVSKIDFNKLNSRKSDILEVFQFSSFLELLFFGK